jgi:hypothetical protein
MATAESTGLYIGLDEQGELCVYGPETGLRLNETGTILANILRIGELVEVHVGTPVQITKIQSDEELVLGLVNGLRMSVNILSDDYFL